MRRQQSASSKQPNGNSSTLSNDLAAKLSGKDDNDDSGADSKKGSVSSGSAYVAQVAQDSGKKLNRKSQKKNNKGQSERGEKSNSSISKSAATPANENGQATLPSTSTPTQSDSSTDNSSQADTDGTDVSSHGSLDDERQRLLELKKKLEEERIELDRIREEAFRMRDYQAEMYTSSNSGDGSGNAKRANEPATAYTAGLNPGLKTEVAGLGSDLNSPDSLADKTSSEVEWQSPPSLPPRSPIEEDAEEAVAARSAVSEGRRVFVIGEAKMENTIRIFFNKTRSDALKNRSTVGIVGAFNGWKSDNFVK